MGIVETARSALRPMMMSGAPLSFGRDIIPKWCLPDIRRAHTLPIKILDIGCGTAEDLQNIRMAARGISLELHGVEVDNRLAAAAREAGVEVCSLDVEREPLPWDDATYDIVIANQVLEHAKEIFWIVSEAARVLKPGGILVVGVPNLASLHNRLLLLFGEQPTAIDVVGPHVRGFTRSAITRFLEANDFLRVERAAGGNFYPFPPPVSKWLSALLPGMSVAIFFLARRTNRSGRFVDLLGEHRFETNYFLGDGGPPTYGLTEVNQ